MKTIKEEDRYLYASQTYYIICENVVGEVSASMKPSERLYCWRIDGNIIEGQDVTLRSHTPHIIELVYYVGVRRSYQIQSYLLTEDYHMFIIMQR